MGDPNTTGDPNNSLDLTLPPTKCDRPVISNMCTPTGCIECWIVPKSLGKPEFRVASKSRWADPWVLGAKPHTRQNIKIGNGNKRLKSKFIATMDPRGDEVRAIVMDKTSAFLEAWKDEPKEAKKVARI
ncbi:hypothetical protein C7212DRAFT_366272 [Tuber magnatum]|uniref:Uncharacterized protein n=1 Tax=Tuber magnatum TaxID=42249 RepID=A0A317SE96_9PEZI|nr:hypothetical protein C7212DRAFT_366272 [Tuber magnatum]